MTRAQTRQGMPYLFTALIASGLVAAVLFGAGMEAVHLEHTTILSTAPELFSLKNQGLAFQRAAAHAPNVLPLYGSSELTAVRVPERANIFFRTAPTGFQVSPVGARGMPPLIILQKVGALGPALRGKKLAISLSPGLTAHPGRKAYEGNFSLLAASEMVFGTALDFELKREIASRMLECPSTLEKSPLLEFALRRLASNRWLDRVVFCALWPIGKAQNAILEMQDHFAAFNYIRYKSKPASRRHLEIIDWPKLIAKLSALKTTDEDKTKKLLSMPIAGDFYDQRGISRSARENYYVKLRAFAQRYHFALVEFKGHDEDSAFLYLHKSHLTAKGWIYYDRALDDFFHGRVPKG